METLGRERTTRLLGAVFRLYSEPGLSRPSVRDIVKVAKVGSRLFYHWYGDLETLYRIAVTDRLKALVASISRPQSAPTAHAAIFEFTTLCAEMFASDDYRRLLYLVVRDGSDKPWLRRKYEAELIGGIQRCLASTIARTGALIGVRLEIRSSASRRFVRHLQAELALPMLLPHQKPLTRKEVRLLVEQVSRQALEAVYSGGAIVRGLEQLAGPPLPGAKWVQPQERPQQRIEEAA